MSRTTRAETSRMAIRKNWIIRFSRLRTVIYDGNPYSADDGKRRIESIEHLVKLLETWGLKPRDLCAKDVEALPKYREQVAALGARVESSTH